MPTRSLGATAPSLPSTVEGIIVGNPRAAPVIAEVFMKSRRVVFIMISFLMHSTVTSSPYADSLSEGSIYLQQFHVKDSHFLDNLKESLVVGEVFLGVSLDGSERQTIHLCVAQYN